VKTHTCIVPLPCGHHENSFGFVGRFVRTVTM
jgi:hypothetical protein